MIILARVVNQRLLQFVIFPSGLNCRKSSIAFVADFVIRKILGFASLANSASMMFS